jgi:hypothetical protein
MARGPIRHDFTADSDAERTVLRAVVDAKGGFTLTDGQPLPVLRPGTQVEIRLPVAGLMLLDEQREFHRREELDLVPAGERLLMFIDTGATTVRTLDERLRAEGLRDVLEAGRRRVDEIRWRIEERGVASLKTSKQAFQHWGCGLEVVVHEPIRIEWRGMRRPRLLPCQCTVVELEGRPQTRSTFPTLNAALTAMSELFELHRPSHGGNAFLRYVWYDERGGGDWYRLGDLRALNARRQAPQTSMTRAQESFKELAGA